MTGDANFVQVRLGGERNQAGVLILPAKPSDPQRSARLKHRDVNNLSAHFRGLTIGESDKSLVGNCFHKAVAERVQRGTKGTHFVTAKQLFLQSRFYGTRMDQ